MALHSHTHKKHTLAESYISNMDAIHKILLAGGTHGNELTGVHLVREWLQHPHSLEFAGLDIHLLLANPDAIRLCRRYFEFDLNRAFSNSLLDETYPAPSHEVARAREINRTYGPKGSALAPDLAIDLHNSTANMGISIILNRLDPYVKRICAILAQEFAEVRLVYQPEPEASIPYLPSLAKRDITIEVGPQAHGTLSAKLYQRTQAVVLRLLELTVQWNQDTLPAQTIPVEVFTQTGVLDYPRSLEGSLLAIIHPKVEGRDFEAVETGAPLFMTFAGETITWQGNATLWPCFLGEAAYLEKRIALTILERTMENW